MYQLASLPTKGGNDARQRLLRRRLRLRLLRLLLDVEADGEHVAVLHLVGLSFEPLQAASCRLRVPAAVDEIVPPHHLAADEPTRDVGVNRSRRLERRLAAP